MMIFNWRCLPGIAVLMFICLTAEAQESAKDPRAALEKWVETRQLIAKTQSDWQSDRQTIQQTIELYERELKSIGDQMSKVSTNNTQVEKERALALSEQHELNEALDQLKTLLAGVENKLVEIAPSFPPPLKDKVNILLGRIQTDGTSKASGLERLQNVVGILNEVDKFNNAVTVVNEIQKNPQGAEVQVETMYLGLAQAYFVDKAGEYAGVGVPTATGWKWTPKKDLADTIKKSLAMYRNATPAAFVGLPVELN